MRLFPSCIFFALLAISARAATTAPAKARPEPVANEVVWEAQLQNFDGPIYEREVETLITQFEASTGRRLVPGPKKKVGLKIYADSGAGLATPPALVHAVITALERRGFESGIFFWSGSTSCGCG